MRALLAVALVLALGFAFGTAPLGSADEIEHAVYVQSIAERGSPPGDDPAGREVSTQLERVDQVLGLRAQRLNPTARPAWDLVADVEPEARDLPADDATGPTSTAVNPPLYYAAAAVAWKLSPDRDPLGRLVVVRLLSALLCVGVVWLTWLLAAELFAAVWARTLMTAVVALHPKLASLAQVGPDALLALLSTGCLLLAVRLARHGLRRDRVAGLLVLAAAAALTHGRGLPLVLLAALVLVGCAVRERRVRADGRTAAFVAAGAVGLAALIAVSSAVRGGGGLLGTALPNPGSFDPRGFLSYLWQFYVPDPGFLAPPPGPPYGWREAWVDSFFGSFGANEVALPAAAQDVLRAAVVVGLTALVAAAVARRGDLARHRPEVLVLLAAVAVTWLSLHLVGFGSVRDDPDGDPVITGRYVVPLLAVYGATIAFVVGALPRRLAAPASGLVVAAATVIALGGLGTTVERFLA